MAGTARDPGGFRRAGCGRRRAPAAGRGGGSCGRRVVGARRPALGLARAGLAPHPRRHDARGPHARAPGAAPPRRAGVRWRARAPVRRGGHAQRLRHALRGHPDRGRPRLRRPPGRGTGGGTRRPAVRAPRRPGARGASARGRLPAGLARPRRVRGGLRREAGVPRRGDRGSARRVERHPAPGGRDRHGRARRPEEAERVAGERGLRDRRQAASAPHLELRLPLRPEPTEQSC